MKKISTLIITSLALPGCFAAPLMPGAQIYHLHTPKISASNEYPQFNGVIINLNKKKPLTATNMIKVPAPSIAAKATANYSVTPLKPVAGYEQWTYPIDYSHQKGNHCYLQFAWDPVSHVPEIAALCNGFYPGTGTNYAIN